MNTNYFKEIARYYQQGGMPQDGMEEALMQAASADASASTPSPQPQMQAPQQQQQPEMDLQAMLDDPNSGVREIVSDDDGQQRVLIVDQDGNVLGERTVIMMNEVPTDVLLSSEGEVLYVFGPAENSPRQMQNGGYIRKFKGFR